MRFQSVALVAGVAFAVTSPAVHANLLTNGGFEMPVISPPYLDIGVGAEPAGFGWSVITNNVDVIRQGAFGWTAAEFEGPQALDLVGFGSTGGIAQTFTTTPGQRYTLSFAYANNPGPGVPTPASANVTVASGGNTVLSQSISHGTATTSNFNWTVFNSDFTATGATTVLAFTETFGGANGGIFLDAVSVASAVPEPSTLASLIVGLLSLGGLGAAGKFGRR